MKLLALDPSLTSTGWAVVEVTDKLRWLRRLDAWGVVETDPGHSTIERLRGLMDCVGTLMEEHRPVWVVIELPAARGLPPAAQSFRGTLMTVTQYAMAVGSVIGRVCSPWRNESGLLMSPPKVLTYPVDEWSKGMPGTKGDQYKRRRAEYAALIWGGDVEMWGSKTQAKDIADAALLAWVGLRDLERESLRHQFEADQSYALKG